MQDLATGERVAIKVEKALQDRESALQREFRVLWSFRDDRGFPDILHFGRQMLNSSPAATDCRVRFCAACCHEASFALTRTC